MDPVYAYAIGGLVGSAVRAAITTSQGTFSKQSIVDVVIGGAIGLLWPIYPVIELPAHATVLQQATIVGLFAYMSGDFVVNALRRLGALTKPNGTVPQPPK